MFRAGHVNACLLFHQLLNCVFGT